MAQIGEMTVGLKFDSKSLKTSMNTVEKNIKAGFGEIERAASTAVTAVTVAATAATAAFVKSSVDVSKEFGKNMSQVAATLGYSMAEIGDSSSKAAQDMQKLEQFAIKMGNTTVFTANQAAEALNYMALAGYDAETSISMLPNVLNLAAAGNFDLARASDMVTDAQTALGLTLGQTNTLVDQMARTASRSNTSVEQLGEAILQIGGTARYMAGGTEEINTVLGVLADNGIKGAEAGTHLRNMLLRMSAPTKAGKDMLDKLGVSIFDAQGKMRSFVNIFPELNGAMASFTDEQKLQAFSELFNVRDMATANALLETTKERWADLGGEIQNSAGAAEQMAAVQLDNLEGDITLFKSALEGAQIQLGKKLEPTLRKVVKWATENIGPFVEKLGGALEGVINFIIDHSGAIIEVLKVVGSLLAGFLAMGFATKVIRFFSILQAFAATNPILLAIMAVVTVIMLIMTHLDELKAAFSGVWDFITGLFGGIAEWFGNIFKGAYEAVTGAFKGIVDFYKGVWTAIINVFSGIGKVIGDAVSGAFKFVVNGVLTYIENFINGPIDILNTFIDVINGAFGWVGVNLGKINRIQLPRLAEGGLATGATTAIIGEAGAEAVLPLEQNTGNWSGLLAGALAEEFENSGTSVGSGVVIENMEFKINSELDAREIGRVMMESIRRAA